MVAFVRGEERAAWLATELAVAVVDTTAEDWPRLAACVCGEADGIVDGQGGQVCLGALLRKV